MEQWKCKRRSKIYCIMLTFILLGTCVNNTFVYAQEVPDRGQAEDICLYASAAALMDADSGRILYSKNGCERKANASTTKIMTCIVALEYGTSDDIVTFSDLAAGQPNVQMNACAGEQYYLKDLLYALMLESYNDVAVAIAEHIAGSVEAFSMVMNEKAEELGAFDTHFVTPNGLDAEGHYTTACDLAKIARYAIQNSEFLEICQMPAHIFSEINGKRNVTVTNHDGFLTMYEGAIGIKTGFTGNAGYCFVGAAKRDDKTLISVVLASGWPPHKTYKWTDTKALMDYGMCNYSKQIILDDSFALPEIAVLNGIEAESVSVGFDAAVSEELLLQGTESIRYDLILPECIEAPVCRGDIAGELDIYINDELYTSKVLLYSESVHEVNYRFIFLKLFYDYFTCYNCRYTDKIALSN